MKLGLGVYHLVLLLVAHLLFESWLIFVKIPVTRILNVLLHRR
jgi:hypothetical protein